MNQHPAFGPRRVRLHGWGLKHSTKFVVMVMLFLYIPNKLTESNPMGSWMLLASMLEATTTRGIVHHESNPGGLKLEESLTRGVETRRIEYW